MMVKRQAVRDGANKNASEAAAGGILATAASAVAGVPLPIAIVDGDLRIYFCNGAFGKHLCQERKGSLVGKKWGDLFPSGREEIEEVERTGRPLTIRVREGWPNDYGTALRDVHMSALQAHGDMSGVVIVIDESSLLERCDGELARQLTHHLRTPLAILEMAVEMFSIASAKGDSARVKVARAIIKHNLDRHRLDIENILGHFRTVRGKRRCVSIATLLREVLKENRVVMDAMGVRCSMVVDEKLPFIPLVRSDMKRVFSVIIQDAVMSAEGVRVSIRADRKKKNVVITVEGSGPPAGRNGAAGRALPAGGVKLSTCRGMIESMGGSIRGRARGVSVSVPADASPERG